MDGHGVKSVEGCLIYLCSWFAKLSSFDGSRLLDVRVGCRNSTRQIRKTLNNTRYCGLLARGVLNLEMLGTQNGGGGDRKAESTH